MRIGILIKDAEYREALVRKLSAYDNDIFVNVIEGGASDTSDSLILTDLHPAGLEKTVLDSLIHRTVFLVSSDEGVPDGCNTVFKFISVPEMISELSLVYDRWRGIPMGVDRTARLIAVCCETDAFAAERCRALAAQIVYSHGGSVLILPLSYINDYGAPDAGKSSLSRLLYSLRSGRSGRLESVTYTDSYGISSMLLPPGRNPVAYLDEEELMILTSGLSRNFDTIIADAGTCFRNENISLLKKADSVVCFEIGRRVTGIEELFGSEAEKRLIRVKMTGGTEDVISMDECMKKIFGDRGNEGVKGRNDKEIRS